MKTRRTWVDPHAAYPYEPFLLHLELFRLLGAFTISPALMRYAHRHPRLCMPDLITTFSVPEGARLLVSIAVICRNTLDHSPTPHPPLKYGDEFVGTLVPDIRRPKRERLAFREACNKLIHAEHVGFSYRSTPSKARVLRPEVWLRGTKSTRTWRATLRVFDFAECAYNCS